MQNAVLGEVRLFANTIVSGNLYNPTFEKFITTMRLIFFQLLTLTLFCLACKNEQETNPEAVLGIKLGMPIQEQYDKLLSDGKLNVTSEGIKFIDFGSYKGSLNEHTFSDNITLRDLTILFVNPNNQGVLSGNDSKKGVLSESNKNEIIKMYEDKYGEYKSETGEYGWTRYIWSKPNMKITLGFRVWGTSYDGIDYYMVQALYALDKKLENKIDAEIKKNNPNI